MVDIIQFIWLVILSIIVYKHAEESKWETKLKMEYWEQISDRLGELEEK